MLTSLDREVSQKILRFEKKISRPEICARTDVGIEVSANETRCLCSLPAVDARRFNPPATLLVSDYPPHTSTVAVCLPDAFDLTATTFLPFR